MSSEIKCRTPRPNGRKLSPTPFSNAGTNGSNTRLAWLLAVIGPGLPGCVGPKAHSVSSGDSGVSAPDSMRILNSCLVSPRVSHTLSVSRSWFSRSVGSAKPGGFENVIDGPYHTIGSAEAGTLGVTSASPTHTAIDVVALVNRMSRLPIRDHNWRTPVTAVRLRPLRSTLP